VIDLQYIHDLNLISARFHALDLDVETRCEELLPLLEPADERDRLLQRIRVAKRRRIEQELARIVIHVWPRPDDPVVVRLRALAAAMVDRVRSL
jgi:hypothetical protein